MKILVLFSNGYPGVVSDTDLNKLLDKNELLAFHRADEWVRVGIDEMRDPGGKRELSWKSRKMLNRPGSRT